MNRLILFLAITACAWSQPTMPFAVWKSAAAAPTFSPRSVANLALWVSSDSITGKSAGDTMHVWRDLSGMNRHLWMLTAARKPVYREDSLNGKPCVVFDATDDALIWDTTKLIGQPFTFFVVYQPHRLTAAGNQLIIDKALGTGAPRSSLYQRNASGGAFGLYAGAELYGTLKPHIDSAFVVIGVFNGASSAVYVNGATQATGESGAYGRIGLRIGGANEGYALPASWYELAMYTAVLSADDRTALTQYFLMKYNLPAY